VGVEEVGKRKCNTSKNRESSSSRSLWSKKNHQITDWFGWEGTFEGHTVQPPAMGRDISNQTRVLRAPSSLAWNGSRDGASPTSLGNLGQGLTTLSVNNFLLYIQPKSPLF